MMKLIKIWKRLISFPKIIVACKALEKCEYLQSEGKYPEALAEIFKSKNMFEGKNFSYHLNLGRIYCNFKKDHLLSIAESKKALSLIYSEKILNDNERQYLLSYTKYIIGLDLYELGEIEAAEKWRTESETHYFHIEKCSKNFRHSYPMPWHVDYKLCK